MRVRGCAATVPPQRDPSEVRQLADEGGYSQKTIRCLKIPSRSFFVSFSGSEEDFFMKKSIIAIVLLLVFGSILTKSLPFQQREEKPIPTSIISQPTKRAPDYFSYAGEQGKNALELLNENARLVERDQAGLVVSINGRKSDSSKREYWAFYVNGKLAEVGPADYKTKDKDTIEWKMEKY